MTRKPCSVQAAFQEMVAALKAVKSSEAGRAAAEEGLQQGVSFAAGVDQRMLCDLMMGLHDNIHAVKGAHRCSLVQLGTGIRAYSFVVVLSC